MGLSKKRYPATIATIVRENWQIIKAQRSIPDKEQVRITPG